MLVRLKMQAHTAVIQNVNERRSGLAVHDACPEPIPDAELQDLANVTHPRVVRVKFNLVFFQQQDVQFCDCA